MSHRITTALRSDTGRVRRGNEDAVAEDAALGLLVLADGMGGHNAGEVASQIAVRVILEKVRQALPGSTAGPTAQNGSQVLQGAFAAANAAIHAAAQANPQHHGMGTTAVAALLGEGRIAIAHVGDSRLYRLRAGKLTAITRDHSLIEDLVTRGHYSRDEASRAGRGNMLTRALGIESEVEVDVTEAGLDPGDIILLCSDGLTDMVDDASIERVLLESGADLEGSAAALVDTANRRGGRDNISVALARVDASAAPPAALWRRLMGR
jgi:protein phosphatase